MMRKPMSLRDAVQKYALGGDVDTGDIPSQNGINPSDIADILRMAQQQLLSQEDPRKNPEVGYGEMDRRIAPEPPMDPRKNMTPQMDPRTSPDRPMEPQQDPRKIPDPYGGYTPMTDDREAQRAAEDKAREQASIAKQRASEQYYYQMARQDLGDGTYRRHRDGAIVDKDNNVIAYPTPPSQPVSPEPPQNYWQNPQEQYAMPPQEQYAVAPPRMEPTRPIPMPVDETGWTAATRPAAQPQSTNFVQSIFGGSGLGTGLPGSAQAPTQNSLDAMINMLQQRNKQ
jgi:hypothetical protein